MTSADTTRSVRPRALRPASVGRASDVPDDDSLVVVANRLPVRRVRRRSGTVWETSPGGLVSALVPILERRRVTWVGWAGLKSRRTPPFRHDGIDNVPVPLSGDEVEAYYEGFSNRVLWPLFHGALRAPELRRSWWEAYRTINARFATEAAAAAPRGATVWIHDYHLMLVPALLRDRRPDVRIGFFLHIPFPPEELFSRLPWRRELLAGLLGADVVGLQTRRDEQNLRALLEDSASDRGASRAPVVETFPISVDFERWERASRSEKVLRRSASLRRRLGTSRTILLGVDRLDYTKGIDARLRAYQRLLREGTIAAEETVLVQAAVPSREGVAEYVEQRRLVERLAGELNGEFGEIGRSVVHSMHRNFGFEELVALYLAADVLLVTPLRDGMNLVAKEYVASRVDERGVLVLSEFAGAAAELNEAMLVNPFDPEGLAARIAGAIRAPDGESAARMRALRRVVRERDVFRWADTFLERLSGAGTRGGRASDRPSRSAGADAGDR
ncbi:MAG: trehalose-6-phosphate synthase [Planctomycetota bacterium JB042]